MLYVLSDKFNIHRFSNYVCKFFPKRKTSTMTMTLTLLICDMFTVPNNKIMLTQV